MIAPTLPIFFKKKIKGASESVKKDRLALIGAGQSPLGTIDQYLQQETGKQAYSVKPARLKSTLSNVRNQVIGSGGTVSQQTWVDQNLPWGYWDQYNWLMSLAYLEVETMKQSQGGATLLPVADGGGTFPRSTFLARLTAFKAMLNAKWSEGTYNKLFVFDLGHTNGLSVADANKLATAVTELIVSVRSIMGQDTDVIIMQTPSTVVIDFQYVISNVQPQQDLIVANNVRTYLCKGISSRYSVQDWTGIPGSIGDDFSHQDIVGDMSRGRDLFAVYRQIYNAPSLSSKPVLTGAPVISSSTPNEIQFTTSSSSLDTDQPPSFLDFEVKINGVLSRRIATVITMTSTGFKVRFSENFYAGQQVRVTYKKKFVFESCISDIYANELDAFTDLLVTNQSATSQPTVTNLYTMDLSGGQNGWAEVSVGTVTFSVVNGYLRAAAVGTTLAVYRSVTMPAGTYRRRIKLKVPSDMLVSGTKSNEFIIRMVHGTNGLSLDMYPYFRRNAVTGDIEFEAVFSNPNANQIRIEVTALSAGQYIEWKEDTVDRLT